MIKLFDDWQILVDDYNYTLVRYKGVRTRNGKEEPVYARAGYFSSLESALNGLRHKLVREKLKASEYGLDEAIQAIREINDKVSAMIEGAVGV